MYKKLLFYLSLFGLILVTIQSSFALQTYIGIKILNLTDDPGVSCVGQFNTAVDPLQQGRIRAISSIVGAEYPIEYPIYFNLSKTSDGSTIWTGNSTDDTDYEIGDVIQIPGLVDLTSGVEYNLFFDIDAIKFYLPLENYNDFEATVDDLYWTVGKLGSLNYYENYVRGDPTTCTHSSESSTFQSNLLFLSNSRNNSFENSCISDGTHYNCDEEGLIGLYKYSGSSYSSERYANLHTSTVGNFNIRFTMP